MDNSVKRKLSVRSTAMNWRIHVDFNFHYLSWSIILVIRIKNKTKQKGEGEIEFYKNHCHRIALKKDISFT